MLPDFAVVIRLPFPLAYKELKYIKVNFIIKKNC